jgi:hypothetical protein
LQFWSGASGVQHGLTNKNAQKGSFRNEAEEEPDRTGTGDYRQFAARDEQARQKRIVAQRPN